MRKAIIVLSAVAAAAILFVISRSEGLINGGAPVKTPLDASSKVPLPVSSVLLIRPGAATVPRGPATSSGLPMRRESANLAQLRDGREFSALYQRLRDEMSPEALYIKAELYSKCATRPDKTGTTAARSASFISTLDVAAPNTKKRIAAYEKLQSSPCEGLGEVFGPFDEKTLRGILDGAANGGDPRAQAWLLAQGIEDKYHARQRAGNSERGYEISPTDLEAMRSLLQSGDPTVLLELRDVLSSTLLQNTLLLNGEQVDGQALHAALALLACDAGMRCGPESPQVLSACANRNQCDANNLYEHTYYYQSSPAQAQLIDRYMAALQGMVSSRNFSGVTLRPNDGGSGYSMVFGGRRRG